MRSSFPDRPVRYLQLRVELRPTSEREFSTYALGYPSPPLTSRHRLYVRPEEVRAALSATTRGFDYSLEHLKEIGARLFSSLFESELGSFREHMRNRARREGAGLQLRLEFEAAQPQLASLPWEFMVDTLSGEFLILQELDTITRSVIDPEPAFEARDEQTEARLLLVAGETSSSPQIETEIRSIQRVLQGLPIDLRVLKASSRDELRSELAWFRPTIFHYCGHADDRGLLIGRASSRECLDPRELAKLFEHAPPQIVVLDTATTETFAFAIAPHVRAYVGLGAYATFESSVLFATRLYERLARGAPVDCAVAGARHDLFVQDESDGRLPGWGTIALYLQGDAPSLVADQRAMPESGLLTVPQSDSRERRKLELRKQALERNRKDIADRIAAFPAGKAPPELEVQRKQVEEELAGVEAELAKR